MPPKSGNQPEIDFRLTEARLLARNDDVARHREFDTTAECEAIDGRDHRNRQILDGLHHAMTEPGELESLDGAHFRHLRDIGARHECAISRAGDDQHAYRGIVANFAQHLRDLFEDGLVQRVERGGRLTVSVAIGALSKIMSVNSIG